MRSLLFDSVILIDVLNDVPEAVAYVREHHGRATISALTRVEVLSGLQPKPASERETAFLDAFPCLPITQSVADQAARLCRSDGLSAPNALQAAVALENSLTLATRNTTDFDPSAHDFVTVPYTLA
jgi:hypothetical protein